MQPAKRSRTAEGAAFLRALHRHVDAQPWIFEDAAVEALLSAPARHFLRSLAALAPAWISVFRQRRSGLAALRAQIVVRARYAEDALAAHLPHQYLVLAAGLDTFALRFPNGTLRVFEVDHPATQAWKRALIPALPPALEFVPVDFETSTLTAALAATTFDDAARTFVSWLGTTYYLSTEAIVQTLRTVKEHTPAGTRLVLDYWNDAQGLGGRAAALLTGTRLVTALQSEPLRTLLSEAEMLTLVHAGGWQVRESLSAAMQNGRYLSDRVDGLAVPGFANLMELEH